MKKWMIGRSYIPPCIYISNSQEDNLRDLIDMDLNTITWMVAPL